MHAFYAKNTKGEWKVMSCDKDLDFLRCCGQPQDARRALQKRNLTWRWT